MPDQARVSSADFIRAVGFWQSEALRRPVIITHHGRARLMLVAPDQLAEPGAASGDADAAFLALRTTHEAVVDHVEEGLLTVDSELAVVSANRAASLFCGADRAALKGQSLLGVLPQPLGAVLADRVRRVIAARKSESFEAAAFDGRRLALQAFPLGAGAGVSFLNITETASLRREVERSAARDAALRHHPLAGFLALDMRARIERVEGAFAELGFSTHDLIGHRFVDLVNAGDRKAVAELIERVLRECANGEIDAVLLNRGGEPRPGKLSMAAIVSEAAAQGVVAIWVPQSGLATNAA